MTYDDGIYFVVIVGVFFHLSYFSLNILTKLKAVNLLVCFSVKMGQTSLCQSDSRIFKSNISLEHSDKIAYFFCILIPEIKSWYKNIGVRVVKNGCSHPGHWTFKLAVSHKGINEINRFFAWWCNIGIANNYWVGMVKSFWGLF